MKYRMEWRYYSTDNRNPWLPIAPEVQDNIDRASNPGLSARIWLKYMSREHPKAQYRITVSNPRKEIRYIAHPVSGDPIGNAFRAVQWVKALTKIDPTRIYTAPWVAEVLAFPTVQYGDKEWETVIQADEEMISRLDGVVLVGGRVTEGMRREAQKALACHKDVTDLSHYASPNDLPEGFFLDPAYEE